jgi:hypothetical protein
MDTLHTVLRSIRNETKAPREHVTVFREFLNQLERIGRKQARANKSKRAVSPRAK